MGKVCHLVRNHPSTLCGVNILEKSGAKWSEDQDTTSCTNCLKLLHGGQMGAPPPSGMPKVKKSVMPFAPTPSEAIDLRKVAIKSKYNQVCTVRTKIKMLLMDLRLLMGDIFSAEELNDLMELQDFLEGAEARSEWALDKIKEVWSDEGYGENVYTNGPY